MGCVCCSLSSFISILLHALERVSLCTVCALLVCCLLLTLITILVLGIGIGYHYCVVQKNVEAMRNAADAASALRTGPERDVMRSIKKDVGVFGHSIKKRDLTGNMPPLNNSQPQGRSIDWIIPRTNITNNAKFNITA